MQYPERQSVQFGGVYQGHFTREHDSDKWKISSVDVNIVTGDKSPEGLLPPSNLMLHTGTVPDDEWKDREFDSVNDAIEFIKRKLPR